MNNNWGKPLEEVKNSIPIANIGSSDRVDVMGSKIFFYSGVADDKVLDLNKAIYEVSSKLILRNIENSFGHHEKYRCHLKA